VHSYSGLDPWRDNKAREALRHSVAGKRLWASEFGNNDGGGMVLAQTIVEDINFLRPTAWVYWQVLEPASAWGLVNGNFAKDAADPNTGAPTWAYYTHYFMAQFTRFLRPGQQVLGSSDNNSIVAYDAAKRQLVIITLNYKTAQPIIYDLSNLQAVGTMATLTTSRSDGAKLFESEPLHAKEKRLQINAAPNSISSIVVNGVEL
jgi:galactan endo-1,6-beta-galactosidase